MFKWLAIPLLALAIMASAVPVRAQHFAQGQTVAAQGYLSYPDVSLSAGAAAVQVLAANPDRVTAICQNTGTSNTARIGDAAVGNSRGTMLYANGAGLTLDVSGAIYAYSQGGTTINCGEIVRP
jgi:hypothetical protein